MVAINRSNAGRLDAELSSWPAVPADQEIIPWPEMSVKIALNERSQNRAVDDF
jgi:hypothetical protein